MRSRHKKKIIFPDNCVFLCLFFIGPNYASHQCCDELNSKTVPNDCTCSDQTGGVGKCSCRNSPNTRQGWLCKKDANGDSVNIKGIYS